MLPITTGWIATAVDPEWIRGRSNRSGLRSRGVAVELGSAEAEGAGGLKDLFRRVASIDADGHDVSNDGVITKRPRSDEIERFGGDATASDPAIESVEGFGSTRREVELDSRSGQRTRPTVATSWQTVPGLGATSPGPVQG